MLFIIISIIWMSLDYTVVISDTQNKSCDYSFPAIAILILLLKIVIIHHITLILKINMNHFIMQANDTHDNS